MAVFVTIDSDCGVVSWVVVVFWLNVLCSASYRGWCGGLGLISLICSAVIMRWMCFTLVFVCRIKGPNDSWARAVEVIAGIHKHYVYKQRDGRLGPHENIAFAKNITLFQLQKIPF